MSKKDHGPSGYNYPKTGEVCCCREAEAPSWPHPRSRAKNQDLSTLLKAIAGKLCGSMPILLELEFFGRGGMSIYKLFLVELSTTRANCVSLPGNLEDEVDKKWPKWVDSISTTRRLNGKSMTRSPAILMTTIPVGFPASSEQGADGKCHQPLGEPPE